ncbi:hypothetical protein [Flavobacterium sp. LHD-85]|uniref:hypothetical protein n=1 Tax=Flavobacterium sp. LHD-85 TaxID=3071410 RepID=UPI0027DFE45C|nr:hypothetical protein [Flavobacterium sp. LHD-85]MDQ6527538.1 hypothetical protein [Flavobacterium sp. LHD-85]
MRQNGRNGSQTKKNPTQNEKIPKCKLSVARQLGNNQKKDQKKLGKSIGKAEKGSTFAPATAKNALRHSGSFIIFEERDFRKKKIRKSLREKKKLFTFAPRKTRKVP